MLADIERFSRLVIGLPLYPYQIAPLRAVVDSVLNRRGHEFLLVFPRQSGKNEAVAHLLVYLLVLLQRQGGQMVYGAVGDGLGRGMRRLEQRLDTPLTRGRWRRSANPRRYAVGNASVVFISSHHRAAGRGETADHLLVIARVDDEVTVKTFRRKGAVVELLPANPDFRPIVVDTRERPLTIEGVMVGLIRKDH